jgi:uncharacterized membrane protein
MTLQKQALRGRVRPLLQVPIVILGLAAAFAALTGKIELGIGMLIFVLSILGSIALSFAIMKTYKCPECSRVLKPDAGWWWRFSGKTVSFRCSNCDIDWDFGLRGQED